MTSPSSLDVATKHAEAAISAEINTFAKVAWEAGYNSGLETAAVAADEVANAAKTPQGQGAARALATRIRAIMKDVAKG